MGYCKQPDVDCYGGFSLENTPEKCLRAENITENEVILREEGHPSRAV